MNADTPSGHPKFEVAVEPAPRTEIVEAEEDEESRRARDAALASTFDESLAHSGKTAEELIEERQDETRMVVDAAILTGVVIAVAEHQTFDVEDASPPEIQTDEGDSD